MTMAWWGDPLPEHPTFVETARERLRRGMLLERAVKGLCCCCGQERAPQSPTCRNILCEAQFLLLDGEMVRRITAIMHGGDDGISIGGSG